MHAYMVNVGAERFLDFRKKVFEIENCSNFLMVMMLSKSLVLEIKKTQINKTLLANFYGFKT